MQDRYPKDPVESTCRFGFLPIDMILEIVLEAGMDWFRATPEAQNLVYGQLDRPLLATRYGANKIQEIGDYIRNTKIKVIQGFPLAAETSPIFSLNLASAIEFDQHAGLDNFAGELDTLDSQENVVGRSEIGYSAIKEDILIGVHAAGSPDKVKYMYLLALYLLGAYHDQLEEEGMFNMTFRATDLSRLNEYLPANMFSRFITASFETFARVNKGEVPIATEIITDVEMEVSADLPTGG